MPKVNASARTAAGPEKVWQLAADLPKVADWNTMHDAFIGDVPATLAEGATYKQRVKMMGMPAEIAWRVGTADEPGKLEILGDGPMGIKAINRIVIEPVDDGSEVTFEMEFNGPALSGAIGAMAEKQSGAAAKQSLANFIALLG